MWITPLFDTTKLTVELRDLVESGVDVWAFDYPSYYKGEEKAAFEKKVIDHYYFRQIGQETTGRWLHYFRTRIREIMPYYLQLYESAALMAGIEDPFGNVDIVETFEQETASETSGTASGSDSGTTTTAGTHNADFERRYSNTPQGSIDNLDTHLTEATRENNTGNDNMTATSNGSNESQTASETSGTVKHTFTKKGNQGVNTYAHDMKELRETFLNIDLMIINELKDLFLQVY